MNMFNLLNFFVKSTCLLTDYMYVTFEIEVAERPCLQTCFSLVVCGLCMSGNSGKTR